MREIRFSTGVIVRALYVRTSPTVRRVALQPYFLLVKANACRLTTCLFVAAGFGEQNAPTFGKAASSCRDEMYH